MSGGFWRQGLILVSQQPLGPPLEAVVGWSEGVVVGEEEGFLMEVEEVGFAGGAAGVEGWGDEPVAFGTGGDEKAVHGPVVVFAEGEAVGGDGEGGTLCGWVVS
jgi:hypothetical protein